MIMIVGLPGAGKTTWGMNMYKNHPEKRYNIVGTDTLIEREANTSTLSKTPAAWICVLFKYPIIKKTLTFVALTVLYVVLIIKQHVGSFKMIMMLTI